MAQLFVVDFSSFLHDSMLLKFPFLRLKGFGSLSFEVLDNIHAPIFCTDLKITWARYVFSVLGFFAKVMLLKFLVPSV